MTLGQLLDRPTIKADIEPLYPKYLAMIDDNLGLIKVEFDLRSFKILLATVNMAYFSFLIFDLILLCKDMFDRDVAPYPIDKRENTDPAYPPYSASVHWGADMKERCEENIEQFKSLQLPIDDEDAINLLYEKQGELSEVLTKFQKETFDQWAKFVNAEGNEWLKEYIFSKSEDMSDDEEGGGGGNGNLVVNFRSEVHKIKSIFKVVISVDCCSFSHYVSYICSNANASSCIAL
jgi:hypothetical protein